MKEFKPPVSERDTESLLQIVHIDKDIWEDELIKQAKDELIKRKISLENQNQFVNEWKDFIKHNEKIEAIRLENNKTESYKIWEMILLFIFGPLEFLRPSGHTIFALRRENYYLKFKQRIIIFFFSFLAWILYFNYDTKKEEEKRKQEIEEVDISDWEKKYGYDK